MLGIYWEMDVHWMMEVHWVKEVEKLVYFCAETFSVARPAFLSSTLGCQ